MGLLETAIAACAQRRSARLPPFPLTSAGVALFNRQYPQGLPETWGAQRRIGQRRYYSWSGTLQPGKTDRAQPAGRHQPQLPVFARSFVREQGQCDGMVGRYSSHLGR
jgi:triacylglycerol lipase